MLFTAAVQEKIGDTVFPEGPDGILLTKRKAVGEAGPVPASLKIRTVRRRCRNREQ